MGVTSWGWHPACGPGKSREEFYRKLREKMEESVDPVLEDHREQWEGRQPPKTPNHPDR